MPLSDVTIHTTLLILIALLSWKYYRYIKANAIYRQSNRRYYGLQMVMDLAQQGWVLSTRTHQGWRIEKASKMFCDILGYEWESEERNGVVGKIGTSLASPESYAAIQVAYQKDTIVSQYLTLIYKSDGRPIWCETSAQTVVFSDVGEKRISVIKDVEHIISRFKG